MPAYSPAPGDFEPATADIHVESLSRPSLSYWQDAWQRLKRNPRALISLYIIIGLAAFTLAGPLVWTIDPALQDLNQISQAPAWPKEATIVRKRERWSGVVREDFPPEPDDYVEDIPAPVGLRTVDVPNTQRVRIIWEPAEGAAGYNIYRNQRAPESIDDLGLPLGSNYAGNEVGYEDRLNLSAIPYYYSVVATDGVDEGLNYSVIEIIPNLVVSRREALERGLIDETAQLGDLINLEFHPFGTDYLGRDMLARLMQGARVSLFIGIFAPMFFVAFGILYGGFAGYLGGRLDATFMRFADFVVALPFLLFMIIFKIAFGIGPGESGILPMLIALVLLGWPATARLVRGQVLQIREEAYIDAARLLGAKNHYLIVRHIIPNTMGVILVTLTFAVPSTIFTEAFLSFIGMGVAPPTPSWGSMCNEGVKTMQSHPHELIFPAAFISITVLAFNLLGDGLTEALDSRLRARD